MCNNLSRRDLGRYRERFGEVSFGRVIFDIFDTFRRRRGSGGRVENGLTLLLSLKGRGRGVFNRYSATSLDFIGYFLTFRSATAFLV